MRRSPDEVSDAGSQAAGAGEAGEALEPALAWLLSAQPPAPADALRRIKAICKALPDPYAVSITVLATHPCVPRELLAATILTFREDLAAYSKEDMATMLVAAWNGGKSGFDAVMRTRANAPKRAASFAWVKE